MPHRRLAWAAPAAVTAAFALTLTSVVFTLVVRPPAPDACLEYRDDGGLFAPIPLPVPPPPWGGGGGGHSFACAERHWRQQRTLTAHPFSCSTCFMTTGYLNLRQ